MRTKLKNDFMKILPWLVLAAAYCCTLFFYAKNGMHNLDADISSEMVLADLLNEEGGLLSANWYYSTELRVVSPVPVYQLGLLLFDSWHVARTFALALLLAGVVASLLYALRGAGVKEAGIYAAAVMIVPFSGIHSFVFVYGGFYTTCFMLTCVLLGLIVRLPRQTGRTGRLFWIVLLSVVGGMGGIRMFMVFGVPLMLACGILALIGLTRSNTLGEFRAKPEAILLAGTLLSLAALGIGYGINAGVFRQMFFSMIIRTPSLVCLI